MAKGPMLAGEEGQLFCGCDGELVRNIQAGEGVLAAAGVPWVLGKGKRIAGDSRAEDFAYVIESAAIGVSSAYAELFEKIVGAELGLQSAVIGKAAIVALQHQAFGTIGAAQRGIFRLSGPQQYLRSGAASGSGGRGGIAGNNGIAVYGLEKVISVIAHITQFHGGVAGDFTFQTKIPAVDFVRTKVVGDSYLTRAEAAWIEDQLLQLRRELSPYVRAKRVRRQNHAGRDLRTGEGVQENHRCGVGDVEIDVVERRIIQETIAAAEHGFAMPSQEAAPAWRVRKSKARPETFGWRIEFGRGALRERNVLAPERGSGIAFALRGQVIEQVRRLSVIGPGQAKVQSEVLADFPIVAGIKEGVILAEIQSRSSSGNANAIGRVRGECLPVRKAERAVEIRQERIGRTLVRIVHAGFESVFTLDPVQVVLPLPGVYDAAFRKHAIQAERQEAGIREGGASDCLIDVRVRRHSADGVGGKNDIQPVEAHTQFIDYVRTESMGIAQQDRLAERGYAHRESGRSVTGIKVEVVATIEQVACRDGVAAQLPVHTHDPVKVVRMRGQSTFHAAQLYSQA